MTWFDWLLVGLFTLGMVSTVLTVGEPRKALGPGATAFIVVIDVAFIIGILATRGAFA